MLSEASLFLKEQRWKGKGKTGGIAGKIDVVWSFPNDTKLSLIWNECGSRENHLFFKSKMQSKNLNDAGLMRLKSLKIKTVKLFCRTPT